MTTADHLLDQIISWIGQREECANKLEKLAQDLESLRQKCNTSQIVGSSTAVAGAALAIGAGVATLVTGGAAAPLLAVAGAVSSGIGTGISVVTEITEYFLSCETMQEAQKIELESDGITQNIQRLFEQLKAEIHQRGSFANPDDLDRHVMTEILKAMARRGGVQRRFILRMLQQQQSFLHTGPGNVSLNQRPLKPALMFRLAGVLSFFTLKASGRGFQLLFAKGGEQLFKEVSKTGLTSVLKGGGRLAQEVTKTGLKTAFRAAGGAIGLAFALPEAISQWSEMINNNHVTEASQSLRQTAAALREINKKLREQLDDIERTFLEFQKLKSFIENSNRSSDQTRNFISIVERYCDNAAVRTWLSDNYNTSVFLNLVDMFYFLKQEIDNGRERIDRDNIDIIFVAHGSIEDPLMPASDLLLLSTIEDVILYSPWNCAIDEKVAYGIAAGSLRPDHRAFCCIGGSSCRIPDRSHWPTKLPSNWNSMRNAGGGRVPNISIRPLGEQDAGWTEFVYLQDRFGRPGRNRVVIPFILPASLSHFRVPFYVVTLALSLVLFIFPFRATLHLAACLSTSSESTLSGQGENLKRQYACTINFTKMTSTDNAIRANPGLYRALRAVFNR